MTEAVLLVFAVTDETPEGPDTATGPPALGALPLGAVPEPVPRADGAWLTTATG
ncbi:MAG: hypothetical protein ACLQK4_08910 [Acidimicrobiales bacterium]|jgi:hypothetical protein